MSQKEEFKTRVEAKLQQVKADLVQAKADAQGARNDQVAKLEAKLEKANETLRDGWENVTEDVAARLNKLLS